MVACSAFRRTLISLAVLSLVAAAGCGGGGSSGTPTPTGSTTVRGQVTLDPGQSAGDVVVQVEGTSLQARPAPDGSFEIRGVPPGNHTISAFSATSSVGAQVTVVVGPDGEVRTPDIRLRPAGQIAGIVTRFDDAGTQQACPGVSIVARPAREIPILSDGGTAPPSGGQADPVDPAVRLTATSAADGTYALKGVAPGAYVVTATLDGVAPQEQFAYVEVARTAAVDFLLGGLPEPKMGRLTGKVATKAADGALLPVAGAQVWVEAPWTEPGCLPPAPGDAAVSTGQTEPGSAGSGMAIRPDGCFANMAVTDEAGQYALAVPQGRWPVQCSHPDFLPARAEVAVGEAATLDFTLEPVPGERPKLEATASVGKESYPRGVPVEMALVLKNVGTVPVTLSFDGQEAGFAVWRGEEVVWAYGSGWAVPVPMPMPEPMARQTTTLDAVLRPGGAREYKVAWNQRRFDGGIVEPGDFVLRAGVLIDRVLDGSPLVEARPVRFRITR